MSAYLKASLVALALLVLILAWGGWQGWGRGGEAAAPRVRLAVDAGWRHAALESGPDLHTLRPGQEAAVPPGVWRVTLVPDAGPPVVLSLELEAGQSLTLDATAASDATPRPGSR